MEDKTYLLEHFETRHHKELERRERIDSTASLPLTLLTLELGFIAFFLDRALPLKVELLCVFFYVTLSASVVLFAVAVYFVFRGIVGYQLALTTPPSELEKYYIKIRKYHCDIRTRLLEISVRRDFEAVLLDQYIECTTVNIRDNNRKMYNIRKAKLFCIVSIVCLALTLAPFLTFQYSNPKDPIQKVQIVNPTL